MRKVLLGRWQVESIGIGFGTFPISVRSTEHAFHHFGANIFNSSAPHHLLMFSCKALNLSTSPQSIWVAGGGASGGEPHDYVHWGSGEMLVPTSTVGVLCASWSTLPRRPVFPTPSCLPGSLPVPGSIIPEPVPFKSYCLVHNLPALTLFCVFLLSTSLY